MDLVTAALGGAVAKVYDDLTEGGFIIDGLVKQSLFTLSCFLLGALAYSDFTHTFVMYVMNVFTHFGDEHSFEETAEKSLLYAYPFFLLLNYQSATWLPLLDWVMVIMLFLSLGLEPIFIKEDVSLRKCILRFLGIPFTFGLWYYSSLHGVHMGIQKVLMYGASYCVFSFIYQVYQLWTMEPIKPEETPKKVAEEEPSAQV